MAQEDIMLKFEPKPNDCIHCFVTIEKIKNWFGNETEVQCQHCKLLSEGRDILTLKIIDSCVYTKIGAIKHCKKYEEPQANTENIKKE